jgi:hypothetical protein
LSWGLDLEIKMIRYLLCSRQDQSEPIHDKTRTNHEQDKYRKDIAEKDQDKTRNGKNKTKLKQTRHTNTLSHPYADHNAMYAKTVGIKLFATYVIIFGKKFTR